MGLFWQWDSAVLFLTWFCPLKTFIIIAFELSRFHLPMKMMYFKFCWLFYNNSNTAAALGCSRGGWGFPKRGPWSACVPCKPICDLSGTEQTDTNEIRRPKRWRNAFRTIGPLVIFVAMRYRARRARLVGADLTLDPRNEPRRVVEPAWSSCAFSINM